MRKQYLAAAITILLLFSAVISFGTVVVRMSLTEMLAESEMVFSGTVSTVETAWNADRTSIFSFVSFDKLEWVKGNTKETQVTLRLRGGKVGNDEIVVSGIPKFSVGERYVIIAREDRGNRNHYSPIVGFSQGAFLVHSKQNRNKEVVCNSEGFELVEIQNGTLAVVPPVEEAELNMSNDNISTVIISKEPLPDQNDLIAKQYIDNSSDNSTIVPIPSREVKFRKDPIGVKIITPKEPYVNDQHETINLTKEGAVPKQILLNASTDPGTRLTEEQFMNAIMNLMKK